MSIHSFVCVGRYALTQTIEYAFVLYWQQWLTKKYRSGEVALTVHGGGEPFLNPQFLNILEFAGTFSSIKTGFLTNGMLLNESWADFIIDIKLDWIAISIDGTNPKTHNIIRKGSDLVRIEKNLEYLLNMKNKRNSVFPHVKLNMVAYDDILDQRESFIEKWINKVDTVMISNYRNPPESKRWPNVPIERKPCPLLWSQAVIGWDGRLGLCCEDFNVDHSPGKVGKGDNVKADSLYEKPLLEIWNGTALSKIRKLHINGEYDCNPLCGVCDSWAEGYSHSTMLNEKGYQVITTPSQAIYTISSLNHVA